jgi:hypothetical protein
MLDAYIIKIIKQEEKSEENRLQLELETKQSAPPDSKGSKPENQEKRGIAIIDFTI